MDEVVQKALKQVQAKARASVSWELDKPWHQPWYTFVNNEWTPNVQATEDQSISKLAVYSWNIDFMLPHAVSRMSTALDFLQSLVGSNGEKESTTVVIYLQECVESDVRLIVANSWIRETFSITDVDISNWQSGHYGTISLVDRRLLISSCFRVHYSQTRMERDVLVVDVQADGKRIRTCNTHLESMAFMPPYRPAQMELCSGYMRAAEVDGAIVAGDFNAIQEFDKTLHSSNDLKDAYLELGGREDDTSGHTWGQQAATKLRNQFGTSRMDKVYFRGGLELQSFEKFGGDVVVSDETEREDIVKLGFDRPWITDHLGVKAVFRVSGAKSPL